MDNKKRDLFAEFVAAQYRLQVDNGILGNLQSNLAAPFSLRFSTVAGGVAFRISEWHYDLHDIFTGYSSWYARPEDKYLLIRPQWRKK